LSNCAISKIPETSHIFKPLLNAVLYFRNLKKMNVTFIDNVRFSGFKCHANLVCHAQHIFTQRISTQSFSAKFGSVSLITQNFSATFLEIFKRKNRREAFSVSSENILHLTFLRLAFSGVEPTPSHYKYNKTFHSAADFP
jgi:hypothetical protein